MCGLEVARIVGEWQELRNQRPKLLDRGHVRVRRIFMLAQFLQALDQLTCIGGCCLVAGDRAAKQVGEGRDPLADVRRKCAPLGIQLGAQGVELFDVERRLLGFCNPPAPTQLLQLIAGAPTGPLLAMQVRRELNLPPAAEKLLVLQPARRFFALRNDNFLQVLWTQEPEGLDSDVVGVWRRRSRPLRAGNRLVGLEPSKRFQDRGLARLVWPDERDELPVEVDLRRLFEALKADQLDRDQPHPASPYLLQTSS